ncbi:MAG TPA: SDR family oxidoreductase, partial [Chloroflexota bacterium]|nr:SDR family oxidoreductase [Chloroflexota bacterium]
IRAANVQVNCVAPGIMGTDLAQAVIDAGPAVAGEREYTQALAAREAGSAGLERAVELCVFLASPASDGITGKLLSAVWDPWDRLDRYPGRLQDGDMYTLRRVVPRDRDADRD